MEPVWDAGIAAIRAFQEIGGWLTLPMLAATALGLPAFYVLLVPAVYWCLDARQGLRLGVYLMASIWLNETVKVALQQPRPFWLDSQLMTLGSDASFGLPSGHAQHAVVMWGFMAASVRHRLAWPAAVALISLIGLSRVYLGVHFPTDVVAGWLLGIAALVALWRGESYLRRLASGLPPQAGVALALVVNLVLALVAALVTLLVPAYSGMPEAWQHNARAVVGSKLYPLRLDFAVVAAGILGGMLAGSYLAGWLQARLPASGTVMQRLARLPLGLAGVGAIWAISGLVTPDDLATPYVYGPLWLRLVLVGLWVSAGAPWLFRKVHLDAGLPDLR